MRNRRAFRAIPLGLLLGLGLGLGLGLVPASPARAEGDGGVRSPFAYGAGNRALALGGAYAALADDASGALWNPAGLGSVARTELAASSASLYGLDISEQFAALALPSWRWGTASVVFRRFAVGGIELRNERNVLLSEFDDSQTEMAVAYGRRISDAWSIGGAAKIQRQSIAGYDDLGIGIDLGLQTRPGLLLGREAGWARRVRLGLAVRNALEPSLRLDAEDVSDPTALRLGLAYDHPLGGDRGIIAAIDLDKTRDVDVDLHAGLEARLHSLIALRGGWNGEGWTSGAGVRWREYAFDYVLEDNEIETVHRFGATVAFGPTTEERRLAVLHAEEEAFRRRLAETFAVRQEARATELAERAQSLLDERRWDEALDAAATLAALAPEDARAIEVQTTALRAKALLAEVGQDYAEASILYGRVLAVDPADESAATGLARCRDESDRRAERTARIRELFDVALDAFTSGDLGGARGRLREILEVSPDDSEARAMLARTETAISARVSALLARAGRSVDRRLFDDAEEAIDEVRRLAPDEPGLELATARLRRAEEELARASRRASEAEAVGPAVATATPSTPKAPALSKKKRREIAELYRSGMVAMQESRPDDALRYWELVWMADPDHENVSDYLKREYLLRGLEAFSRGGLDDAIRLWEKALDVDPADEKTLSYLARAREQHARSREILGTEH